MSQVHPIALGRDQSEKELHIWDPDSQLDEQFKDVDEIKAECRWGAGLVGDEVALILYVFNEDQTIEIYFPQKVAVGPDREMNSWDVLLSQQPESLVLVYGDKPTDNSKWLKVVFETKTSMLVSLEEFANRTLSLNEEGSEDPVINQIAQYFSELVQDDNGNEKE